MSLATTIQKINKKFGEGTIVPGKLIADQKIQRVTSGSLALDLALGGGWPINQWHELIGYESSGKTVVALKTIAANQAIDPNYTAFWLSAESLPMYWALQLGIDLDRLYVHDTNIAEEAFDAVLEVLDSREVDCVVIDSLPALMPLTEDEQQVGDFAVGSMARLTNKFCRKASKVTKRSLIDDTDRPVLGIMINQWREKIGVMHGDPRTTPGGLGKNYFYFTRTEVRRAEWLTPDDSKEKVGQRIAVRVTKNKSAPGQRTGEFDFYFADGGPVPMGAYDALGEVLNLGIANNIIVRRGRFYDFDGERVADGREALQNKLRADPDLRKAVTDAVLYTPSGPAPNAPVPVEPKPKKRVIKKS